MIISKAPLRMSFVGGGSDLPTYYKKHGGAVLSTTIDKYIYVNVNKKFDDGIRVAYSKTELVNNISELQHELVKNSLNFLKIRKGVEITSIADIPSKGTGLGSSSTFTTALLHVLNAYKGNFISKEKLAEDSCKIEIEMCKEPIGKQDQYAASFGGLNIIEFNKDDSVNVMPIITEPKTIKELNDNLLMFYTGISRSASKILMSQSKNLNEKTQILSMKKMVGLVYDMKRELENNRLDSFGEILDENWKLKKTLSKNISSLDIDDWYSTAKKNGALGGKILGAGAGGFLLLYAHKKNHEKICNSLKNLRKIDFKFENEGSKIIYYKV